MRTPAAVLFCCILGTAGVGQVPTFRSSTHTVAIYATVTDGSGHSVTDLRANQFQILDNGKPAPIAVFTQDPQSLTLLMMFDTSASIAPSLNRVRQAANASIDALQSGDRARVGSFGAEIAISPHLTSDKTLLKRVVREELWPGFKTRLWSALQLGLTQLSKETGRRALIVLSDGSDSSGSDQRTAALAQSVRDLARNDDWMIYAVNVGANISRALKDIVNDSGGRALGVRYASNLPTAYQSIMDEMRHQYLLGFVSEVEDGSVHRIDLRTTVPGLIVRARQTYIAERQPR